MDYDPSGKRRAICTDKIQSENLFFADSSVHLINRGLPNQVGEQHARHRDYFDESYEKHLAYGGNRCVQIAPMMMVMALPDSDECNALNDGDSGHQ